MSLNPFIGWRQEFNHRHKLMKQVTTEAPPALKTLDPGLPTDLTTAQYRLAVIQRELGSTEQVQSANAAAIQQLANEHPAQLQHQRALAAQELALATAAGLKA